MTPTEFRHEASKLLSALKTIKSLNFEEIIHQINLAEVVSIGADPILFKHAYGFTTEELKTLQGVAKSAEVLQRELRRLL